MAKFQMKQDDTIVAVQRWQRIFPILLSSAIVGVVTWVTTALLSQYVIGPIACRIGSSLIGCSDSLSLSSNVAVLIGGIVALVLLVRQRTLRPLLAVIAAVITLWGIGVWFNDDAWYVSLPLTVLLATVVYATFAWFSELRQFWMSLSATVILVVIFRLLVS